VGEAYDPTLGECAVLPLNGPDGLVTASVAHRHVFGEALA
jgi:hypothetical protein